MKSKFLKFGFNKSIFEKHKFGEETFKKFSYVETLPISVNDQILTYYSVQQEKLTSDGNFLG